MQVEDYVARHAAAAEEFDRHEGRHDGGPIAYSLTHGMNTLRSLLCARIREDVENYFGKDSTIMPVSVAKSDARINGEIEVYQVAEVVAATREMGYIKSTDNWFTDWLGRLRLDEQYEQPAFRERLAYYLGRERQAR